MYHVLAYTLLIELVRHGGRGGWGIDLAVFEFSYTASICRVELGLTYWSFLDRLIPLMDEWLDVIGFMSMYSFKVDSEGCGRCSSEISA